MKVRDFLQRGAVTIECDATLVMAARMMADHGVGTLVVTDHGRLTGVVTDRDLVIRAMAKSLAADARVDSIMSMNVVAIDADWDVRDAQRAFSHHAVRRLPVLDGDEVVGLLSIDDLLVTLTEELTEVTRGVTAQLMFPHAADLAPPPAVVS
jgi:predicted transcriptional regulator